MSPYIKKVLPIIFIISSFSLAQNYGTWTLTDSLNIPRQYAASIQLLNGNILVTGGEDSVGIRDAELFYYKTEKWHLTNPMIIGRASHKMILLNDGRALTIGGFGTRSCEIFDITTETWYLTDSLNYERTYGETLTLLDNGNVLVTGGFYQIVGVNKYLSSCEIYDVNTAKWTVTDSLRIAREGHTATKLLDGRILIAGGFNGAKKELTDCEIYDPIIGRWSEAAASLNIARYEHSATLLSNGKVLITGGKNYSNPTSSWLNSCELYDPVENTWSIIDSLFVPHTLHSPILLMNGLLLIAGGSFNSSFWELYDPNNFSNIYLENYPDRQANPLINLLPNGKVLTAGGMTWTDGDLPFVYPARMCYIYDPEGISDILEEPKGNTVRDFRLYQNYPNPFNPSTTINYHLPIGSYVSLKVFDMLGRQVVTLVSKEQQQGNYKVVFEGSNLPSGIYVARMESQKFISQIKMILLK